MISKACANCLISCFLVLMTLVRYGCRRRASKQQIYHNPQQWGPAPPDAAAGPQHCCPLLGHEPLREVADSALPPATLAQQTAPGTFWHLDCWHSCRPLSTRTHA